MSRSFTLAQLDPEEIHQLTTLQAANLKSMISEEMAEKQGFLTFQYTPETISAMMAAMPQPIAKSSGHLVGYALATSLEVCRNNPLLNPAVVLSDTLHFKGKRLSTQRYYVMGQICVADSHRGAGIFDALYQMHKSLFENTFDCVVTEIATTNKRSLAAHTRVGFQPLHIYNDGSTDWQIVVWDWTMKN